jgi:hypothetical protein
MSMSWGSTTWTMGRILGRVHETGDDVVVYAGDHAFAGVVRGVGDHLVTLEVDEDIVVIRLASVTGVRLRQQARELAGGVRGRDGAAEPAGLQG